MAAIVIEGLVGPMSYVGPALVDWSKRKYIAGVPPTPTRIWCAYSRPTDDQSGTLMPDLDVAETHANEMATLPYAAGVTMRVTVLLVRPSRVGLADDPPDYP